MRGRNQLPNHKNKRKKWSMDDIMNFMSRRFDSRDENLDELNKHFDMNDIKFNEQNNNVDAKFNDLKGELNNKILILMK